MRRVQFSDRYTVLAMIFMVDGDSNIIFNASIKIHYWQQLAANNFYGHKE